MSDAKLTKELGMSLLARLAEDDEFRARFEAAPARALVELGVPAEVVVQLKPTCIERRMLAGKETFRALLREGSEEAIASAMQMIAPKAGFKDRSADTHTLPIRRAPASLCVTPAEQIAVH